MPTTSQLDSLTITDLGFGPGKPELFMTRKLNYRAGRRFGEWGTLKNIKVVLTSESRNGDQRFG